MYCGQKTGENLQMEAYPFAIDSELHGINGFYNHCHCITHYRLSLQYVQYLNTRSLLISLIDKLTEFNWIVTAFTLTSTSTLLIYGQIADVFGRHSVIQASIFFVLVGSVLGAAAQVWPMLLLGRAFQGLGFGGLAIVTKLILSDKVSLKENSVNNTIFALLNGLSVGVGPVIGGYLTKVGACTWVQIAS
jgi:MFS family permease